MLGCCCCSCFGLPNEIGEVAVKTGRFSLVLRFAVMGVLGELGWAGCIGVMAEKGGGWLEKEDVSRLDGRDWGLGVSGAGIGEVKVWGGGCSSCADSGAALYFP